jgi:hypothetical protein
MMERRGRNGRCLVVLNIHQDTISDFVIHAMVEVFTFSEYPFYEARIGLNGW